MKIKRPKTLKLPIYLYILGLLSVILIFVFANGIYNRELTTMDVDGTRTIEVTRETKYYLLLDTMGEKYDFTLLVNGNFTRVDVDAVEIEQTVPFVFMMDIYDESNFARIYVEPLPEGKTVSIDGYDAYGTITLAAGSYVVNPIVIQGTVDFGDIALTDSDISVSVVGFSVSIAITVISTLFATLYLVKYFDKPVSKYKMKHVVKK